MYSFCNLKIKFSVLKAGLWFVKTGFTIWWRSFTVLNFYCKVCLVCHIYTFVLLEMRKPTATTQQISWSDCSQRKVTVCLPAVKTCSVTCNKVESRACLTETTARSWPPRLWPQWPSKWKTTPDQMVSLWFDCDWTVLICTCICQL